MKILTLLACLIRVRVGFERGGGDRIFAVSADGQRFYIRDASGNLLVFDRQGKRVAEIRMPAPLDCAEVAPDGSIVTVGSCQYLRLHFRPSNSDAEIEEIGDEQRIWVIRSDGTIDKACTEGFNRALGAFLDKHARRLLLRTGCILYRHTVGASNLCACVAQGWEARPQARDGTVSSPR